MRSKKNMIMPVNLSYTFAVQNACVASLEAETGYATNFLGPTQF